jgi:cyclin B
MNAVTKENGYANKYRTKAISKGPITKEMRTFRNITNLHNEVLRKQKDETALRKLQRLKNISSKSIIEPDSLLVQSHNLVKQTPMELEVEKKKNPQDCDEYSKEIDEYGKSIEGQYTVNANYMLKQKDINSTMRAILVDWLTDVHIRFKLKTETLFLTINILDRYLEKEQVKKDYLQLIGVTAVFISSKCEEIYPPELKDFVYITDYAYTKEQILCAEQKILYTLGFNLNAPTSKCFLQRLSMLHQPSEKVLFLAQYLLELSLIESGMLKYEPSVLACSALNVASELYGEKKIAGCSEECKGNMMTMLREAPNGSLQAVRRKFSTEEFLGVARIELQ